MAKKDKKDRKKKKKSKKLNQYTAKTADKYELYQLSVQSPEPDVAFLKRVYKKARGEKALHFREDFCGTGLLSAEWIKSSKKHTAEGFDYDAECIDWGLKNIYTDLGDNAERMVFHENDVRTPSDKTPDITAAQNFSYWILKTRAEMLEYFTMTYNDLSDKGVFVMDAHGGPESYEVMEEESEMEAGFTYVWDQDWFSPVTNEARLYIHFRFEDGTQLKKAFRYDWRIWSIPEIRDILIEAGFKQIDVYWEGTDEDGESGNGIYRKTRYGEADLSWVAYIVALK